MSRRKFLAASAALAATPAMPSIPTIPLEEAVSAVRVFPAIRPDLLFNYAHDFLTGFKGFGSRRMIFSQPKWTDGTHMALALRPLAYHLSHDVAFLEYLSGFADDVLGVMYQDLLKPRERKLAKDFSVDRQQSEFDIAALVDENSPMGEFARALQSKQHIRDYIIKSFDVWTDMVAQVKPHNQHFVIPMEAAHLNMGFTYAHNFYIAEKSDAQREKSEPGIDWSDRKAVNFLIENNLLHEYGVRPKLYEIPADIARLLDGFERTSYFAFDQWRKRPMYAQDIPLRDVPLRVVYSDTEAAYFKTNQRALHDRLREIFGIGDKPEHHGLSLEMLKFDPFDQTMPFQKRVRDFRIEKLNTASSEFDEVSCLFLSPDMIFSRKDDGYQLRIAGSRVPKTNMVIIERALSRKFQSVAMTSRTDDGLLVDIHPLFQEDYEAASDIRMLDKWVKISETAQKKAALPIPLSPT